MRHSPQRLLVIVSSVALTGPVRPLGRGAFALWHLDNRLGGRGGPHRKPGARGARPERSAVRALAAASASTCRGVLPWPFQRPFPCPETTCPSTRVPMPGWGAHSSDPSPHGA